jgi:glycolate oxidase FAD binding subunit
MPQTPGKTTPGIGAFESLAAACDCVRPGAEPDAVGGIIPAFVVSPSSTAAASAALRACAEHDLAVVPRGSGSRLDWGVPPSRCDVVIDMLRMGQVIEHAAGDLVARLQAGARLGEVAAVLGAAGQEIALDVPAEATIGGVIADALAGPRRLRYGSPRDLLIGITVVRADGTVARSGGKVVKNVAGYDLGKLFAGSAGTLGLVTEATFRLHPLPVARAWVTVTVEGTLPEVTATAAMAVAAAANSPLVASAVELDRPEPGGQARVGVLLEGSADGVAARAEQMADVLQVAMRSAIGAASGSAASSGVHGTISAATPAAPDWWRGVPDPAGGTLLRVTFWVSALARVLDAIDEAARATGSRVSVHGSAGAGLLYVTVPDAPEAVAGLVSAIRAAIPAGRGGAVVLSAPEAVHVALGADGLAAGIPGAGLMRAVKEQFDPDGRLSPGRLFS